VLEPARKLYERYLRFLEGRGDRRSDPAFLNGILATPLHGVAPGAAKLERLLLELQGMREAPVALIEDFQGLLGTQRQGVAAERPDYHSPRKESSSRVPSRGRRRVRLPARA